MTRLANAAVRTRKTRRSSDRYLIFAGLQTQSPTDKGEVNAVRNANDMIAFDVRDC